MLDALPPELLRIIDSYGATALACANTYARAVLTVQSRRRRRAWVRARLRAWCAPLSLRDVVATPLRRGCLLDAACAERRLLVVVRVETSGPHGLRFWVRESPYCRAHTDTHVRQNILVAGGGGAGGGSWLWAWWWRWLRDGVAYAWDVLFNGDARE